MPPDWQRPALRNGSESVFATPGVMPRDWRDRHALDDEHVSLSGRVFTGLKPDMPSAWLPDNRPRQVTHNLSVSVSGFLGLDVPTTSNPLKCWLRKKFHTQEYLVNCGPENATVIDVDWRATVESKTDHLCAIPEKVVLTSMITYQTRYARGGGFSTVTVALNNLSSIQPNGYQHIKENIARFNLVLLGTMRPTSPLFTCFKNHILFERRLFTLIHDLSM